MLSHDGSGVIATQKGWTGPILNPRWS